MCEDDTVRGQDKDVHSPITIAVTPPPDQPGVCGWGQALIGPVIAVRLHIEGFEQPISVDVSDRLVLGRDVVAGQKPDIDLNAYEAYKKGVSRTHAALMCVDDTLRIMDLNSANGTYLNGQRLAPYQHRLLRDGDLVRLGNLAIRISWGSEPLRGIP